MNAYRRNRSVILPLLVVTIGHFIVDFMLGIWPVYKTMLHLDLVKAGLVAGVCATLGEGMQLFFGPLSDMGRRKAVVVLGIGLTMSSALLAYVSHWGLLGALLFVSYVGSGAFHPAGSGLAFCLSPKRRGLMVGIFAAGGALGLAFSQIAYASVYTYTQGSTLILALPIALIVIWALFQPLPETPLSARKRPAIRDILELFRIPSIRRLYFAQVLNQAFYWAFLFLLPDVLYERGYETWLCHGGAHCVTVLGVAFTTIPLGFVADRYGARNVLIAIQAVGAAALYFILASPTLPVGILLATLFVMGACGGSMSPIGVVLGNQIYPDRPGLVSALLMGLVWLLSEGLGPGVGGALTALFDQGAAAKSLAILALGLLGSISLMFGLPAQEAEVGEPSLQKAG